MKRDKSSRWLSSVAWLIALLVGILPPALHYSLESKALRSEITASVKVQSLAITRVINRHPETWRFHDNLMGDLIAFGRQKTDVNAAERMTRIIGNNGESIVKSGELPPAPRVTARAGLFESGRAAGHIEHTDSLRPVLWKTLMLALASTLSASIVFFVLKLIPLRAIENAISDARRAASDARMSLQDLQKSEAEIQRLNADLERRITERTKELQHSNVVLEQRNQESEQITELSNLLQIAVDMHEAADVLSRMMGRLLAPHTGAIYLTASSLNRLECLAEWGDAEHRAVMGLDDCWGVRRARTYVAADPRQEVFCAHVKDDSQRQPYICVPMMAQSMSLGMLHVKFDADVCAADLRAGEQQRVQRLADQVAMALANLKLRQSLREQSIRDALTGLYNRRYLEETLDRECARAERENASLAVFMIDVDHFKRYNDQHGHAGGDAALRALARILRESLRASDLIARYGGEEFTALLHNTSLADARQWGERLCEMVRRMEVKFDGQILPPVTVSLGLALRPDHAAGSDALLQAADLALYGAKRSGRDRLVVAVGHAKSDGVESRGVVLALPKTAEAAG